nr:cytochrome c biogenesis protein CcsA [Candidatus Ozemobacteraceae bacterium]
PVQIAGFILAGICAWLEWRSGEIFFSLFVLPVAAALFGLAALVEKLLLGSHFSGPWFFLHVGFSIAGECLFFMAALAGATYLFALKRLKEKNRVRAVSFFPPLLRLEKLMTRFLNGGSSLFAIGLTAGFVWSWLQFAVFDPLEPKKGLSTLVLLGFGGVSVATRMGHLSGPRVAWCVIGGFLLSMLVMIGIDSSMHWYPK